MSSFKALGVVWLIAGLIFCLTVKGPGTISAWMIWGTGVFLVGWVVVGLPIVAFGDRVFRVSYVPLVCAAGLGGALLMFSPTVIVRMVTPNVHFTAFSIQDLAWPAVAFLIAAATAGLYRFFLSRARWPGTLQQSR